MRKTRSTCGQNNVAKYAGRSSPRGDARREQRTGQRLRPEDSHSTSWGTRELCEDACRAGSPIVVIVVVRDNRAFQRMLANK